MNFHNKDCCNIFKFYRFFPKFESHTTNNLKMRSLKASIKVFSFSIIFFSLCFTVSPSISQPLTKRQILDLDLEAQEYFHMGAFHKALPIYLRLDTVSKNDPHYAYPIGVCYIQERNEAKAIPFLERCLQTPDKYPYKLNFYLATAYHFSHRMDDAIKYYEIYKLNLKKKVHGDIIKEMDRQIEMCKTGKELMAKPLDIQIYNLGKSINSKYPEYGAVISADEDELIFTSNRPNTTGGGIDASDGRFYEDIYIAYKDKTGKWSAPVKMGSGINSNGHDASISLTADGQKLILYRNIAKDNIITTSAGELFVSDLHGNTWSKPVKLPAQINNGAYQPSACLSEDERVLYFSSNREGGEGGTDLYQVKKLSNGQWALPQNMGKMLNTPYDEDSPYLHPDGKTLYFSSNGHKTMGGYDIFVSRFNDSTKIWSSPENVGYPISTAHDDIHFSWSADAKRVYFSSIRPEGEGDKDIYYGNIEKEAAHVLMLKGIIYDSLTSKPMEAVIKVTDVKSNELVGTFHSNSISGKYIIILPEGKNYSFTIEAATYAPHTENFDVSELHEFKEIDKNIALFHKKK
jgi:Tol biopolymer transport system component